MPQTMITGGFLYLTAKLSPGGSSFIGDRDLGIDKGRLKMRDPNNPDSTYTEWIEFNSVTAVGDGTFTYGSLVRQLSQVSDPAVSLGTGNTWVAGTEAKLVAMHDQLADRLNGVLVPVYATTVARDAALPSPTNGMSCYVTADGVFYDYQGGAWATRGNSATANASTTVAGKVEIGTQVEVDAGTDTGGTGATLAVIPSTFISGTSTIITGKLSDQATAEAGADNTKLMTPLRVAQAVAYQVPTATTSVSGRVELADSSDILAGTANRAVTSDQLPGWWSFEKWLDFAPVAPATSGMTVTRDAFRTQFVSSTTTAYADFGLMMPKPGTTGGAITMVWDDIAQIELEWTGNSNAGGSIIIGLHDNTSTANWYTLSTTARKVVMTYEAATNIALKTANGTTETAVNVAHTFDTAATFRLRFDKANSAATLWRNGAQIATTALTLPSSNSLGPRVTVGTPASGRTYASNGIRLRVKYA